MNEHQIVVQIAEAVENSEVDIDPKIKSNLEEKILTNISEVAKEASYYM